MLLSHTHVRALRDHETRPPGGEDQSNYNVIIGNNNDVISEQG